MHCCLNVITVPVLKCAIFLTMPTMPFLLPFSSGWWWMLDPQIQIQSTCLFDAREAHAQFLCFLTMPA